MAEGIGGTIPDLQGYADRFNKKIHHALTNLGVSGETSTTFIDMLDEVPGPSQLYLASGAITDPTTDTGVVTLDVGANDLLELLASEPVCDPSDPAFDLTKCKIALGGVLTTFAGNYGTILGTLATAMALSSDPATIMVLTAYNPFDGTGNPLEPLTDLALLGSDGVIDCTAPADWGLNDIIACTGGVIGVPVTVVDVHPHFDGSALILTHIAMGDPHPSNAGHAVIANALQATFKGS